MSNIKQFKIDLKKANAVYGYVAITENDGSYIQLVKQDLLEQIKNYEDSDILYTINDNCIYIN